MKPPQDYSLDIVTLLFPTSSFFSIILNILVALLAKSSSIFLFKLSVCHNDMFCMNFCWKHMHLLLSMFLFGYSIWLMQYRDARTVWSFCVSGARYCCWKV